VLLTEISNANRVNIGLLTAILALSCIPSQAQAVSQQTRYGYCTASTSNSQTVYFSSVFSLSASASTGARAAFLQSVQTRDSSVGAANCSFEASQQAAITAQQAAESMWKNVAAREATAKQKTTQIVDTGWQYQSSATSTTKTTTATDANHVTNSATNISTPAANPANSSPKQGTAAKPSTHPQSGASSSDNTVKGQDIKQSMDQSAEGLKSTSTGAVTGTVNNMSTATQSTIKSRVQGLQDKLFHKGKSSTSADTPASEATHPRTNAVATAPADGSVPATASVATAASHTPSASAKPAIQEEGDGKHVVLITPGQSDARELTLVSGTKNVYIEESTGDKYVVMPSGDIAHIPHKNVAR
jgi:hypothetical protein